MPKIHEFFVTKYTIHHISVILKKRRLNTLLFPTKLSIMNENRQETLKKAALKYRETLRKSLERRLEAARASGNESLIRQLEAEANYLHMN